MTDITVPPYPSNAATSASLYRTLQALRAWVIEEYEELRHLVPEQVAQELNEPPPLPPETVWEGVGVFDKFATLRYARAIRETWDHVVRDFESAWDSEPALRRRFHLATTGASLLENAFVDPETREAQDQKELRRQYQKVRKMIQFMDDVADGADTGSSKEPDPFDSW